MTIRNFEFLLRPRSVALVGASARPGSVGMITARNLLAGGFTGPISFVIRDELGQAMLAAARPHLLRIQGPNCLGLMLPGMGLNAGFSHQPPLAGDLAFLCRELGFDIGQEPGDGGVRRVVLSLSAERP